MLNRTALLGAALLLITVAGSSVIAQSRDTHFVAHDRRPLHLHSNAHRNHETMRNRTGSRAASNHSLICPVTGDKIASANAAAGHSVFHGKKYYFCCADCKPRFDKSPGKFVKNAAAGRYEKM